MTDFLDAFISGAQSFYDVGVEHLQNVAEDSVEAMTFNTLDIGKDDGNRVFDFAPTSSSNSVTQTSSSESTITAPPGKPVVSNNPTSTVSDDGVSQGSFQDREGRIWAMLPLGIPEDVMLPSGKIQKYLATKYRKPVKKRKARRNQNTRSQYGKLEREMKELKEFMMALISKN